MLKVWKWNSGIFALQGVSGGIVYFATGGDVAFAALAVSAALFVFVFAVFAVSAVSAVSAALVGFAVSAALFAASAAVSVVFVVSVVSVVFVVFAVFAALAASAASAALVVKEDGAKENIFLLFLTALPLGIGIILGGILLILLLIKRKQT